MTSHRGSYSYSIVNVSLSCTISDIFSVQYWRELETWVKGHSRSLKMALINRSLYDLGCYQSATVTIALSYITLKLFDIVTFKSRLGVTHVAFLDIPDAAYNWLVDFFVGHGHCTRYGGTTSTVLDISASIIQGSSVQPPMLLMLPT